jgi:hypothetical protein
LMAAFAARRGALVGDTSGTGFSEFAADELAVALRLTRAAAGARLHVAVELDQRLPQTAAALSAGTIDLPKARAIVDATAALEDPTTHAVEDLVLPQAGEQTLGQLRAALTRAVITADPDGGQTRHEHATAARTVTITARPDGMAELWALLPAQDATAIYTAIDLHAHRNPQPGVPIDARRADALHALVTGTALTPTGPLVHLTVPATTLLDLDDDPGELAGHVPVPALIARRIAADPTGTWRRILTDPLSGTVLDVGTTTYRPPAGLARHVRVRDVTCRFPGCRQPARRCDLDHLTPHPQGPTADTNLITLCRHHHRLKHQASWQITGNPNTTITWTTPTGQTYGTHPPRNLRAPAGRDP